jgi:hypothetical protein
LNQTIDLMPASCREWLGRRLRIRRWTLSYLMTICALAGAYAWIGAGETSRRAEMSRLSSELKQRWLRDEQVQSLLKEIQQVETMVTRYNRLAWPVRVTEAIDAVGAAMPDAASLTSLQITPREEQVRVPVKKSGNEKPADSGPRTFMVLEMEGVARTDQDVALLVAGLEKRGLFARVALDYTRALSVDGTDSREYRLTCEVDLSLRYAVVSAEGGE